MILNKIKTAFKKNNKPQISETDVFEGKTYAEREQSIFGEERVLQQRLFEKWAVKEEWHLKNEGTKLILAIDPAQKHHFDTETKDKINDLWLHAKECVTDHLLQVINPEEKPEAWRVSPAALYRWAKISRVSVPAELSSLMDFVLQTILSTEHGNNNDQRHSDTGNTEQYNLHKEIVLGASLSLLASKPDVCKSRSGKIKARLIAEEITKNSKNWFEEEPLLAQTAMQDLIEQYLFKSQNPLNQSTD